MYACMCHAVTVSEVEAVVLDGATTVEDIGEATGAGTGCGCCHGRLLKIMSRADAMELAPALA